MIPLSLDTAKHAIAPEGRDVRDAPAMKVDAKDPHDFKHQLDKAKPAKKAMEDAAIATPPPVLAVQPDPASLVQIIAALLNGAAKPGAEPLPDIQKPLANVVDLVGDAAAANAKAASATIAQGAPDKLVQQMIAVAAEATDAAPPVMTPLEQAVHDLLSELADKKAPPSETSATTAATAGATFQMAPATTIIAPQAKPDVQPTAPVAPAPPPAELVSQNHAHLVLDDANGRVVLTVAVRGSEVNVSVRATDDATAASLARNAASLDDAMRGRGLQLAQFDAQRDLAREQHAEKPKYEREIVKKSNAERFTLEENL